MSRSPAHRPGSAALAASLVGALLAAAVAVPVAGVASTSPDPAALVRTSADGGPVATTTVRPAAMPVLAAATPRAAAETDPSAATSGEPPQQPSVAYEEAVAHEHDRINFEPGGRVTVGFRPRSSDAWPVAGKRPVALPAGRATGREMAASAQGSGWAHIGKPGLSKGGATGPATGDPAVPGDPSAPADPALSNAGPTPDPAAADAPAPAPDATPSVTPASFDQAAGDPAIAASPVSYVVPSVSSPVEPGVASGLRRQVYGFLPYWEVSGSASRLNYDALSTIAYFSVGAASNGNLKKRNSDGTLTTGWAGWTSSSMTSVINAAHQRGTLVVMTISVFAWTTSTANVQKAILGSPAARSTLAKQAAAAVRDRGADGVNLDFEPLASGYATQFVAFLKTLRAELNRVKAGYEITYDTTGSIGNYPLEASVGSGAADAIFVMGYDYRTGGSATAGSIDPLSGPKYDLTDTVRAYTARVAPSRVILGLPWYGRAWSTTSSAAEARNQSGTKYGASTTASYETIVGLVAQYGRRWDPLEQSPYIAYQRQNCTSTYGCVTSWRQLYYEDGPSLKLRLGMVNDYGLRGAGMWALGNDGGHPELYRAITDSFLVNKTVPLSGIKPLPGALGDEGFVVSWTASAAATIASYDVQVSANGGAWTAWVSGTTATSNVWLGKDGAGYAFRVRARDTRGTVGPWNVASTYVAAPTLAVGGFGRVVTDGMAYRTGPDTSAGKLGTLRAGTIVAVTRGPVSADGYAWFEVTQPIVEWGPVGFVERGVWVAARSSAGTNIVAARAPNTTRVDAGIAGLDFGADGSAVGIASADVVARMFSPNGDGSEDAIRLRWTNTVALDALTLKVFTTGGTLVGTVPVSATAAGNRTWDWNGKVGGTRVADGRYVLQLVGTAGAKTYSAPSARPVTAAQIAAYAVTVDTTPPVATSASASGTLMSPNGDGYRDSVKVLLASTGATRWTLAVANARGVIVRTAAGTGGSVAWTWTGTSDAGAKLADGPYTATIAVWDEAGNRAVRSFGITLDTTPPVVTPGLSARIFSPNGDGAADTTTLSWSGNETATGTARVLHGTTLVRAWTMTGVRSWHAAWNGRNTAGASVPDGRYTFQVVVKDAAGNARTVTTPVVVDRTSRSLGWSRSFFPQDGDAIRPTSSVSWTLTRTATTTLSVVDMSGALVRQVWTGRSLAAGTPSWTWNGRRGDGSLVPQGEYVARLTVTSSLGTQTLQRGVWAAGFAITTSAATVGPGQTLTVTASSIEPLAAAPKVSFTQPGRGAVVVTSTRLADGRYRASFKVATGSAGQGTITVTGKDTGGHANTTAVHVTVRAS